MGQVLIIHTNYSEMLEEHSFFAKIPTLKPFVERDFVAHLADTKLSTEKVKFFQQFIRTPTLLFWLKRRKKRCFDVIQRFYLELLQKFDYDTYFGHKKEVLIVDVYLSISSHIVCGTSTPR